MSADSITGSGSQAVGAEGFLELDGIGLLQSQVAGTICWTWPSVLKLFGADKSWDDFGAATAKTRGHLRLESREQLGNQVIYFGQGFLIHIYWFPPAVHWKWSPCQSYW